MAKKNGRESQQIGAGDVGEFRPLGVGAVLPPRDGSTPTPDGPLEVRIDGIDDSGHVRCVYPDGFVKHHQAETVEELAAKVTGQLRGRFGMKDVAFTSAPTAVESGQSFTVGAGGVVQPPPVPLPPRRLTPTAKGDYEVKIERLVDSPLDDRQSVQCSWPDGETRHYDVGSAPELAERICLDLRALYGVREIRFSRSPLTIEPGEVFGFTIER